eukprot:379847_1
MSIKVADKLKNEGNKLFTQQKYQQSILKYDEAIKSNPHNAIYYANRSAARSGLLQFKQAANDAKRSIELDPCYAKGYSRLAFAYQKLHKYQDAIVQYKLAFNHSPKKSSIAFMVEQIEICLS